MTKQQLDSSTQRIRPHTIDDSEVIRSVRLAAGMSQQAFADLLQVSISAVRSWEQGRCIPTMLSARAKLIEMRRRYLK